MLEYVYIIMHSHCCGIFVITLCPLPITPPTFLLILLRKNRHFFGVKVYRELIDSKGVQSHRGSILALKLKASRTDRGPALHDGFQIAHYAGLKISWLCTPGGVEKFVQKVVGVS